MEKEMSTLGVRMIYYRKNQTFSVKGHMVTILGFMDLTFYSNYSTLIAAEKQP